MKKVLSASDQAKIDKVQAMIAGIPGEMHFMGTHAIGNLTVPYTKYTKAAADIAALVVEKQKAYGNSFGKSGQIMKILYPNGVTTAQMEDSLTVVRILDKLFRIATDKTALGESPWKDITGYALLALVRDDELKQQQGAKKYDPKAKRSRSH